MHKFPICPMTKKVNISLQVKVMASEAAMTLTADSKAERKSAENTQFQQNNCA